MRVVLSSFMLIAATAATCLAADAQQAGQGYSVVTPEYLDSIRSNGDWEVGGSTQIKPTVKTVADIVIPAPTINGVAGSPAEASFNERDFQAKKQLFRIKYPWQMVAPYGDSLPGPAGIMTIDPPPNFIRPITPAQIQAGCQNGDEPRLFNGVDSLYEKLPTGGFRDLRDGSIWDQIPRPAVMGNIAAYRKKLLDQILHTWKPQKPQGPIVSITISHHGQVIHVEMLESSGNKNIDKQAVMAVFDTKCDPLPDWFNGEQLTFKVNMAGLADGR